MPSRPILACCEKRFFDGIELIRSGVSWSLHQMTPQIQSLWRLIGSRQAKSDKGNQKGNRDRRAKRKANQRTTTKLVNLEKESQNPGKGKGNGDDFAVFAESGHMAKDGWSSVQKCSGTSSVGGSNQSEWTNLTTRHSKEELAIIQFKKVLSSLNNNGRNGHLSTSFMGTCFRNC